MLKLQGEGFYLAALSRDDCRKLWADSEYDFENPTDRLELKDPSDAGADRWYDEIQKEGDTYIRLGLHLEGGEVIGVISLQGIDWQDRKCSLGAGLEKIGMRKRGYTTAAVRLILDYAFNNLGLERVSANTLEPNIAAQKCLEKCGLKLEGRERKSIVFGAKRWDKLLYGILREEFNGGGNEG